MSPARRRIGLGMLPHPDGPHTTSGYASYTTRLLEHFRDDPDVELVPMLEPANRWGPSSPHRVVRSLHRRLAKHQALRAGVAKAHAVQAAPIEYTAPHLHPYSEAGEAAIEWSTRQIRELRLDACHFILTGALGTAPYEACLRAGIPYAATVVDYGPICAQGILRERDERICTGPETTSKCVACMRSLHRSDTAEQIERRQGAYAHYYGRAKRVFTFTRSHAAMLGQWLGIGDDRFAATPFAVPHPAAGFTKAADAFTHPLRFAFVARTCPEWGVAQLVEAWRAAAPAPDQAVLELYTDDGFARSGLLESSADLIAAGSLVVATERVADHLDEVHADTAVVVVPSLWRNTGSSSGLEALVRATPVITNDEFGMFEDLPEPMRDLAYPTGDVAALAARIRELVDEPGRLAQLSRDAHFDRTFADHVAPIRATYLGAVHVDR